MFKNTKAFSGFSVNNIAAAKQFYGTTLGLDVEEQSYALELKIAGGTHVFIYPKDDHTPATFTVLNFPVDAIDEAVDTLRQKGITFEHYPGMTDEKDIARGIAKGMGPDIAWFKDPAGNILSVLQEG